MSVSLSSSASAISAAATLGLTLSWPLDGATTEIDVVLAIAPGNA